MKRISDKIKFTFLSLFVAGCFLMSVLSAEAIIGPSQTPGSGGGLFTVDSNRNIGFGVSTSTPSSIFDDNSQGFGYVFTVASTTNPGLALKNLTSGNTFLWSARNSGRLDLYRESGVLPGKILMSVNEGGDFGISAIPTTTARFYIGDATDASRSAIRARYGSITIDNGAFVGNLSGSVSAGNVTGPSAFGANYGTYNFAAPGAFAIGTSVTTGLPANGLYVVGNVGIGTTAPGNKLDVVGNIGVGSGSSGTITALGTNTDLTVTAVGSAGYLRLGANGTNRLAVGGGGVLIGSGYMTSTPPSDGLAIQGNVGIGTSTPAYKLHIYGSGNQYIMLEASSASSFVSKGSSGTWYFGSSVNGVAGFNLSNSGAANASNIFISNSTGNVGIGTTTPSGRLDVAGGQIKNVGTPTLNADAANKSYVDSIVGGSGGTWTTNGVNIYNANSGNVGVGTATPGYKLQVNDVSGAVVSSFFAGNDRLSLRHDSTADTFQLYHYDNSSSTEQKIALGLGNYLVVDAAGNVGIGPISPDVKLQLASGGYLGFQQGPTDTNSRKRIGSDSATYQIKYVSNTGDLDTNVVHQFLTNTGGVSDTPVVSITRGGNVGIATTTPTYKLDVVGTSQFSQPVIVGTPTNAIHAATKSYVDSVVGGSGGVGAGTIGQTLRHDGTGWVASSVIYNNGTNVGIGTTGPGAKLDVRIGNNANGVRFEAANLANSEVLRLGSTINATGQGAYTGYYYDWGGGGTWSEMARIGAQFAVGGSAHGDLVFSTANAGSMGERMRIQYSGNVGIGVANPESSRLLVRSSTSDSSSNIIQASNLAGATRFIVRSDGRSSFYGSDNGEKVTVTETGNVGIGTTGPGSKLTIDGVDNYTNGITIQQTSGYQNLITAFADGANPTTGSALQFKVANNNAGGNAAVMTLKGSGNVGIGTSTPTYKLDVVGTSQFSQPVIVGTPTANTHATTKSYVDSAVSGGSGTGNFSSLTVSGTASFTNNLDNVLRIGSVDAHSASLGSALGIGAHSNGNSYFDTKTGTNGRIEFRIGQGAEPGYTRTWMSALASSGNVGIGTTGPGAKLHIKSNGDQIWLQNNNSGAASANMQFLGGGTDGLYNWNIGKDITANDTFQIVPSTAANGQTFSTAALSVTRLGNVGIGTTSPGNKLTVVGDITTLYSSSNDSQILLSANNASYNLISSSYSSTGSYKPLYLNTSDTTRLAILANGNVGIGTTSPGYKLDVNGSFKAISSGGIVQLDTSGNFIVDL